MAKKVLIVEDEAPIREMLAYTLTKGGYLVSEAADAEEALGIIQKETLNLVLIDWMLPGMSGLELAKVLCQEPASESIPIIMLTAKGQEHNKVNALDVGVDDYITKPFSNRELLARMNAVIRRSKDPLKNDVIAVKDLSIDPDTYRVKIGEQEIKISLVEFKLLYFFVTHPERVYSRSQILDHVWGPTAYVEERTVDVHIRRLRKILKPFAYHQYIQTVRGVGYRFSIS